MTPDDVRGMELRRWPVVSAASFDWRNRIMKTSVAWASAGLVMLALTAPADAKGCLKGAVVGGVAGHYAGHHGVIGAIAGCAYGRHRAKEQARHEQQDSQQGRPPAGEKL